MKRPGSLVLAALLSAYALNGARAGIAKPSRAPAPKCAWEQISDVTVGLQTWVQRCDYGFRKIDFLFAGKSLAIRYSDGGGPDPLVDVLDLLPGETHEAGIRRVFLANTDPKLAARCVLSPYRGYNAAKLPAGARRYTFVPNRAYAKELKRKADPNEVGDPACGA